MSKRPEPTELGPRTVTPSLAVQLVDGFSGEKPVGKPRVSIEGVDVAPIENLSGYLLFLDLDPEDDSLTVFVDGGERYLDEAHDIDIADLHRKTPLSPAITIELTPSAAYEFPTGTTLVRGYVRDPDGNGVAGAELSVRGLDSSARTERDGEFVLPVGDISPDTVTKIDGKRLVRVDDENPLIEVSHPTLGSSSKRLAIEEAKMEVTELICG